MRIGVVSDTHDNHRSVLRIIELFHRADVAQVVHTGDITRSATLSLFGQLNVPLTGVFGNNDHRQELWQVARQEGFRFADPVLELSLAKRHILVIHDPHELETGLVRRADVLLHGHTHRRVVERRGRTLVFNPGECAGLVAGHNAVGVLDLGSLETEILHF
jgi:putative phosphoesterase